MIAPDMTVRDRISALIEAELQEAEAGSDEMLCKTARAMSAVLCTPRETQVNFSGGIVQRCWSVTRGDGDYRVIYMPVAGYFALCAESVFGPLDIGVHGSALGCFGSV